MAGEAKDFRSCVATAPVNRFRAQAVGGGTAPYVPHPGAMGGPCHPECTHQLCALQREIAAAPCTVCQRSIGYGNGFAWEDAERWTHDICLLEKKGEGDE